LWNKWVTIWMIDKCKQTMCLLSIYSKDYDYMHIMMIDILLLKNVAYIF
jgi:hypothetical protein